jgi:hypothetical protein
MTNIAVDRAIGNIGGSGLLLFQPTLGIRFAKDHTVRVTDRLSHLGKKVENVSVVVQQGSFRDIVVKARSSLSVQGIVEIFFNGMESHCPNGDNSWWKIHILSTSFLRPAKQTLIEDFILQREHCAATISRVAITLNHVQNMLVKVGIVGKSSVTAILACTILDTIMEILAAATLCFAKVMRHGIDTKKANETVELSNPVKGKKIGGY